MFVGCEFFKSTSKVFIFLYLSTNLWCHHHHVFQRHGQNSESVFLLLGTLQRKKSTPTWYNIKDSSTQAFFYPRPHLFPSLQNLFSQSVKKTHQCFHFVEYIYSTYMTNTRSPNGFEGLKIPQCMESLNMKIEKSCWGLEIFEKFLARMKNRCYYSLVPLPSIVFWENACLDMHFIPYVLYFILRCKSWNNPENVFATIPTVLVAWINIHSVSKLNFVVK